MKKALLLATAAFAAVSAMAEVFPAAAPMGAGVDLTPAGYKFNTYGKDFIGYVCSQQMNWNMSVMYVRDNFIVPGVSMGDGHIVAGGPLMNGNQAQVDNLAASSKIVDFGGTTGKVLAINFGASNFAAKYKELTGADLEIGSVPANYTLLFWHFDPETVLPYAGDDKNMPVRVRIEWNIFHTNQASDGDFVKVYANDDSNNVRPMGMDDNTAPDINVKPAEFAYRWCDKDETTPDDDSTWDEGDNGALGEWNPNRWMVYEWDIDFAAGGEENPWECAPRLKMEIPGANNIGDGGATLLIRSINLYAPDDTERERIYKKRPRTWNTYTVGAPEQGGVEEIAIKGTELTYTVAGSTVTFSTPAKVYTLAGALVAEGTTATLAQGIYVAQAGGKAVKFIVK